MVPHCGFDLHFSDNEWCWTSFYVFVSHPYVFFGEISIYLAHFLIGSFIFLELSCRSCLYVFEISCFSVASFAVIFSHSEGCFFTLPIVSFVVQKILSLIKSHLFIFTFISNILKQLEKEEMKYPRVSRRKEILKIRAEINAKETKEIIAKINKTKAVSLKG